MATPTKRQRPRPKSRVVSAPEATRNHPPFPGSTQFRFKTPFVTGSSSSLFQADLSGHPYISVDSGSDSELSTTRSRTSSSSPSPLTSPSLTPRSSLSPSPTRAAVESCEGGSGGHQRSASEGNISTRKRTKLAPPESRAGRPKGQATDLVRKKSDLGETPGDSGAPDAEVSVADTPQELIFTVAYKPRLSPSIAQKVFAKLLTAAFKSNDQQKPEDANDWGCIYILQNPEKPEYVKIGRTEFDPQERLQQWLRCGCELNFIGEPTDSFTRVPCHKKLEILIHAMLYNERRKFACRRCTAQNRKAIPAEGKESTHGEWFQIDKDQALRLVKLGRDWMSTCPYGEDGELTKDWKDRVTRLRNEKAFTQTLEQEIAEGRRWESFLTMPDATRLSRIRQWVWDKRLQPNGRWSPSRYDFLCRHWERLFAFCVLHYLGVVMLSWYCYARAAPYMFLLATLSSAAFAL